MEKLSYYVRKGNDFPQIKEDYAEYDGDQVVGTCALGGVTLALKGDVYDADEWLRDTFHLQLDMEPALHPITREYTDLLCIVAVLNDENGWSRAQIADWLESIGH